MKSTMRILTAATLLALAPLALAQAATTATNTEIEAQSKLFDSAAANKGQTQVAEKIAAFFASLAGSKENAVALVTALRNGTAVSLTTKPAGTGSTGGTGTGTSTPPPRTTTTFTPPTGKMGWGNVKISLGLAQDALLRAGITKPTAAQLQTALMGGSVTRADGTTVTLKGVLQMRADGMGWGQIAHAGGTKVGPVVSSLKATQAQLAALPPASGSGTTTTAATAATSKGVTTAAGSTANAKGSLKGVTTAGGAASSASGVLTAEGGSAGHQSKGNAYGRGIVSGAGGSVGSGVAATGHGNSSHARAGVVTAGGANASSVTSAQGSAGGSEHGKGKGKGG